MNSENKNPEKKKRKFFPFLKNKKQKAKNVAESKLNHRVVLQQHLIQQQQLKQQQQQQQIKEETIVPDIEASLESNNDIDEIQFISDCEDDKINLITLLSTENINDLAADVSNTLGEDGIIEDTFVGALSLVKLQTEHNEKDDTALSVEWAGMSEKMSSEIIKENDTNHGMTFDLCTTTTTEIATRNTEVEEMMAETENNKTENVLRIDAPIDDIETSLVFNVLKDETASENHQLWPKKQSLPDEFPENLLATSKRIHQPPKSPKSPQKPADTLTKEEIAREKIKYFERLMNVGWEDDESKKSRSQDNRSPDSEGNGSCRTIESLKKQLGRKNSDVQPTSLSKIALKAKIGDAERSSKNNIPSAGDIHRHDNNIIPQIFFPGSPTNTVETIKGEDSDALNGSIEASGLLVKCPELKQKKYPQNTLRPTIYDDVYIDKQQQQQQQQQQDEKSSLIAKHLLLKFGETFESLCNKSQILDVD